MEESFFDQWGYLVDGETPHSSAEIETKWWTKYPVLITLPLMLLKEYVRCGLHLSSKHLSLRRRRVWKSTAPPALIRTVQLGGRLCKKESGAHEAISQVEKEVINPHTCWYSRHTQVCVQISINAVAMRASFYPHFFFRTWISAFQFMGCTSSLLNSMQQKRSRSHQIIRLCYSGRQNY